MSDDEAPAVNGKYFSEPDDLDCQVTRLQALLENEELALDTECALQTLERCFRACEAESLDEQIFGRVLAAAHRLLSQVLKSIDETTGRDNAGDGDLQDVKRKLRVCDGLLVFWRKCVEHVSALERIRAFHVASLCRVLPDTMRIVFEHCKASPKTYGVTLLDASTQDLRNLFSLASATLKLFRTALDDVIVFDTDVESETELLTKVVDAYGAIASLAYGMDMKTYIELSEIFAKLAVDHESDIKHASPNSVAKHLGQVAKDVSLLLSTIQAQTARNVKRTAAVIAHLLKILEKLMTTYVEFIEYETLLQFVGLSAQMHGCSCVKLTGDDERTIPINAAPLVDIIFAHSDFKQAYFEYGKGPDVHRLNYHALTIAVMKKLNSMPYEHHCKWSLGMDSILDVAFTHIEHLQEEIIVGELRLPGAYEVGERPRLASIYEATLVSICSLASQIPSGSFHALELLLLKHLLSGRFWSSLLSSDVWCFVSRLGTPQLCAGHVRYLLKVSAALSERRDSRETAILNKLIHRLYELLDDDAQSALLDDLTELETDYYTPVLYVLAAETKDSSMRYSNDKLQELPRIFSDLQEHRTTRNWKRLMRHVSAIRATGYSDNKDIIDTLVKIWSFVADTITECEDKQLDMLSDFIISLFDGTRLEDLQNDAFDSILTSVVDLYVYMPPRVKIKLCQHLRQNVNNFDRYDSQGASALIKLFNRLLVDENCWIRQEALELFEHVGHVCSERLVSRIAKNLAKIPAISNIMQAYLSCTSYYKLEVFVNMHDYLGHVAKVAQDHHDVHTCYEFEESEREEKIPRIEEDNSRNIAPTLIQLDEQAERLHEGLTEALAGRASISETVCRKLMTVLKEVVNIFEK